MRLEVPYFSQIGLPFQETEMKWCGLASLAMVLGYHLGNQAPTPLELVERYGELFEARGFLHADLIAIARDGYGLGGFRKSWFHDPNTDQMLARLLSKFREEGQTEADIDDWQRTNLHEGLSTLRDQITVHKNPVIVSVSPQFSPSKTSHLVVGVGVEGKGLVFHDPYKKGAYYHLPEEKFTEVWLRRAVIITGNRGV